MFIKKYYLNDNLKFNISLFLLFVQLIQILSCLKKIQILYFLFKKNDGQVTKFLLFKFYNPQLPIFLELLPQKKKKKSRPNILDFINNY